MAVSPRLRSGVATGLLRGRHRNGQDGLRFGCFEEDGETMGPKSDPPIVGIGASAGGIKALQNFFEALPSKPNATFVVVIHLDPEFRSQLAGILGARTAMPVAKVEGSERLENNHVYVIAPDR